MKTDELVALLAAEAGPIDRHVVGRRYGFALCGGALVSAALMLGVLGLRPDLDEAVRQQVFWIKLLFAGSIAWASWLATERLSRPGKRLGRAPVGLMLPVLALWALAAPELAGANPARRSELLLGATWQVCPWLIALLSTPVFAAALWAMRGLAPTRLALAGGAAGLLAGAVATLVYSLHCPETGTAFVGIWYLLGMLLPGLLGIALGRPLLRW